jgi:ABC-2 type transport system permease protein
MRKVLFVAIREFLATAATKGFIIGALVVPAIMGAMIPVIILLTLHAKGPEVAGEVVVIDRSREVGTAVVRYLSPESLAKRLADQAAEGEKIAARASEKFGGKGAAPGGPGGAMAKAAASAAIGPVPKLSVRNLDPDADPEKEKGPVREAKSKGDPTARLAVAVVD